MFNSGPQPPVNTYRPISVTTPDGLTLVGTLYIPNISAYKPPPPPKPPDPDAANDAAAGGDADNPDAAKPAPKKEDKPVAPARKQYPLVILVHMLSGSRWDWKDLPRHLVNSGYAVLAFDLRGHGDSVYQGKELKAWREFDHSDWQKMPDDITVLSDYIAKQPEFNMVDTHKIALIGASIGANIAVNYASKHDQQVQAMVLLSPGLEYHGIETFTPMSQI